MSKFNPNLRAKLSPESKGLKPLSYYVDGIKEAQDLFILSEAITLLESQQATHRDLAYQILLQCEATNTDTLRVGITGSPGVGKSTFIEYIGLQLRASGHRLAVLTIDPTSTYHQGSILGDKTRMEQLSKYEDVFIRPSPTSMHLGGSHQYTAEAILMCEAAGFDHIIIETVGVGQSEIEIAELTDINILLLLPGAGDALQGVKMGVMETADMVIIHKADGDDISQAYAQLSNVREAIHTLRKTEVPSVTFSSLDPTNSDALWSAIMKTIDITTPAKSSRRKHQEHQWLTKRVNQFIQQQVREQLGSNLDEVITSYEETSQSQINNYLRIANRINIKANIS